jgi:signal transduction histidine kinase
MKMSGGPASMNLKIALVIAAILIAAATLIYTQDLVKKLQDKEREIVELYAQGIQYMVNTTSPDVDLTFLFDNIIKPIDFPLILTDAEDRINIEGKTDIRNVEYDSSLAAEKLEAYLAEKVREMDEVHSPILVTYADSIVLQKIHYGDSELIQRLRFYPYLQILIAALFILLGYIGFSNVKRNEQSNIWVGMAKETAHQFGTPISSLMGWLEMLKINYRDPDKVLDIAEEVSSDVDRLNRITYRFSKIGASPELKTRVVYEEIRKVIDYFHRRLPQTGRIVSLNLDGDKEICARLNSELFEWVVENLIKNSLDAIDHKEGKINFTIKDNRNAVEIEVSDNGKGIEMKRRKDIFRPGYSTKRRGWGLGLSLSKRIIEEYHKGKIYVKNSIPGEGTTFKIIIPKD